MTNPHKWEYGLLFDDSQSFLQWFQTLGVFRINSVHVHHTYIPNYSHFKGNNHRALQDGMRNTHKNINGWDEIGQHLTIFPDGKVMTGRNPEQIPVSAKGYNGNWHSHPFAFEMIGNFDIGNDVLKGPQLEAAVLISRYWHQKGMQVVFHRECLINGKPPKTCPGTSISKDWFMDLVKGKGVEEYMMKPDDAAKIISLLSAAYGICKTKEDRDEFHRLANEVRKTAGLKET